MSSLGGVQNIIRISNDLIEVRNPKLINEIDLKCEVKENQIKIMVSRVLKRIFIFFPEQCRRCDGRTV